MDTPFLSVLGFMMADTENDYYTALGRFVDSFALAESAVQLALWKAVHTEDAIAKAVFSGTRTRQAIDYMRRISESTGVPIPPGITAAFSQLNAINSTRDGVIHWGSAEQDDGSRIVTNRMRAHTAKSLKEFPISAKSLYEMSNDLGIIVARLVTHYLGRDPEASDEEWEEALDVANAPFLYKPPQPNSMGRK